MSEVLGGVLGGALESKPTKKHEAKPTNTETAAAVVQPAAPVAPHAGTEQVIQLTGAELAKIIENAQVKGAEIIAAAMIEAKKPYVDPAQELNKESARESMRRTAERNRRDLLAGQENCVHLQGSNSLSSWQSSGSSFVLHRLDTGETVGICSNCQKVISSLNPDDRKYFRVKSGNVPSAAGVRSFQNPTEVQLEGRMLNDDGSRATGQ